MRLMLPPALEARTFVVVAQAGPPREANQEASIGSPPLAPEELEALRLVQNRGGRLRLDTLLSQIHAEDPQSVFDALSDRGLVSAHFALVPPKPAPARVQYVRLLADDAAVRAALPRLGRPSKQADLLWILARHRGAPLTLTELCDLAGCSQAPVRALAERGWVEITARRTLLVALPGTGATDRPLAPEPQAALSLLLGRGGAMEMQAFLAASGASPRLVAALEKRGLVQRITEEPVVLLTLAVDQVLDRVLDLRGSHLQRAVLEALRATTGPVWVGGIYAQTGADSSVLRALAERGLVSLHAEEYERPLPTSAQAALTLTPDQAVAWQQIEQGMARQAADRRSFVALLHGVTGSGKTEIYLRALAAALAAGQRAIVLVPEISLTAQTVRRFEARFPGRVAVLHSQLSLGQRYAVWDRVRRGQADVLIGPRSALFAPVSRLGLIVVDEEHDESYKQSEPIPLPAYHGRDAAVALGRLVGAAVLLGSATPDLVSYYRATQGTFHLIELPRRIVPPVHGDGNGAGERAHPLPPVRIVDLRQELRAGNRSILSRPLQEALHRTLSSGEQAILFLNRRGAATFVLCRDCGHVLKCPKCSTPLTYHQMSTKGAQRAVQPGLVCHRCNHREPAPARCPNCGGHRIRYFGLGTERVEEAVQQLWPGARLLRWDRDTAASLDHERFLQTFTEHRADVLIGTQMIAKGLDLPLVTLVGVISADTALHLPDYRAAERTFQLLTQVAGRAGRSHRGGQVIVQTYNPEDYAIEAAARHDFAGFYRREVENRRRLGYPPFSRLVALRFSDPDARRCRAEAERLGKWLAAEVVRLGLHADLIGPVPCFFSRVQGRYRWQIVVRSADPMPLLRDVALPRGWRIDVDPVTLL
jgi:primosomal protein N' (replication factor Y)